jgi:trk system potassium uptake protein TrkH
VLTPLRRIGLSLFHSVSAFCNAGFDLTGASLVPYRNSSLTYFVVGPLIILGGLGFPVLNNIVEVARDRFRRVRWRAVWNRVTYRRDPLHPARLVTSNDQPRRRLTLHTKLVLVTTLALFLWGLLTIGAAQILSRRGLVPEAAPTTQPQLVLESTQRGVVGAIADASFMSISARTAGFNSLPMDQLEPASRFSIITLMIVGGSPGGAAGGLKTTVLAVLLWSVLSTIRQRRETEVFGRAIADSLVRQAGTVAICYLMLIVVSTLLLSLSEKASFGVILFEAVSAATTTGLSLGLTFELTPFGKVVIIATMFLGRVGPLALFAALVFRHGPQRPYAYPHESVALG